MEHSPVGSGTRESNAMIDMVVVSVANFSDQDEEILGIAYAAGQ